MAALLVFVLTGAMCFISIATVGRSVAAEDRVKAELELAGARELTIANSGGWDLIGPDVVTLAGSMSGVERAVGFGTARDVSNGAIPGANSAPAWGVSGDLEDVVTLVEGRWPDEGEALVNAVSRESLGFSEPVGSVTEVRTGESIPVVGSFVPKAPFGDLDGFVVYEPQQDARELRVVLADVSSAQRVQDAVLTLLGPMGSTQVAITSPATVADLHTSIVGTLGRFGAGTLALVLTLGALLVAAVVTVDTAMASGEWGRRRALGASRSQLVALATLRVGYAATIGAVCGVAASWLVAQTQQWQVAGQFSAAVAVLSVLVALASTLLPATRAAWRDPVAVLRTP